MRFRFISTVLVVALIISSVPNFASSHSGIVSSPTTACEELDSTDFATHATNQIFDRLADASPTNGLNMYTSRPGNITGNAVRNPNVWTTKDTPLDFTGVAGFSSYGGHSRGATLITPRHFVTANHWSIPVGQKVVFYDASGNPVVRTVTGSTQIPDPYSINGYDTDIQIQSLDSDVPDSITYYPILASTTLENLLFEVHPAEVSYPVVTFNQFGQALVREIDGVSFQHSKYISGPAVSYSENLIGGDSGQPGFVIVDGKPVLLFAHFMSVGGPELGAFISEINEAIDELDDSGYSITEYTPNCFDSYDTNYSPRINSAPYQILINQNNYSTTTAIATVGATDPDTGQVLTFSIESLTKEYGSEAFTPTDYFSIDESSGEIMITNIPDPEVTGNILNMTVAVTDDGATPSSDTYEIIVRLYDFNSTNFALSSPHVSENGITGTQSMIIQVDFDENDRLYMISGQPIVLSNSSTTVYGAVRFTPENEIDPTYNSGIISTNGTSIRTGVLFPDGRMAISGPSFTFNSTTSNMMMLNPDGSVDTDFMGNVGVGPTSGVNLYLGEYNDDLIAFLSSATFNGTSSPKIVRLNNDGVVDSTFKNNVGIAHNGLFSQRMSSVSDGNYLMVGGAFTAFNGTTVGRIVKLNSDGTINSEFLTNSGTGFDASVADMRTLSNGKIVVIGGFTSYNGIEANGIVLLNSDGTLDEDFAEKIGTGVVATVTSKLWIGAGDHIYLNTNSRSFNGINTGGLTKLNPDGTVNVPFHGNIGIGASGISSLSERSDGAIVFKSGLNMVNDVEAPDQLMLLETGPVDAPTSPFLATQSGLNESNTSVSSTTVLVEGLAAPGAIVYIQEEGITVATTTADWHGNYEATLTLSEGEHTLTAYQTLTVTTTETSSSSEENIITVDVTEPEVDIVTLENTSTVSVTFTESIMSDTPLSGWVIQGTDNYYLPSDAEIDGNTLSLTLSSVVADATLTIEYVENEGSITDEVGNELQNFSLSIDGVEGSVSNGGGNNDGSSGSSGGSSSKKTTNTPTNTETPTPTNTSAFISLLEVLKSQGLIDQKVYDIVTSLIQSGALGLSSTDSSVTPNLSCPQTKSSYTFTRDLELNSTGEDVLQLQKYLNQVGFNVSLSGIGSIGLESDYFGDKTKSALIKFQNSCASSILAPAGLTTGTGYFGSLTRQFINP